MTVAIPSLNWLRVFEAAARCESFARAATQLNMSSAAVSQQVRALEDRLGKQLFERHAHAVTLTEAGRAYLPSVQQALLTLESATDGLFGTAPDQQLFLRAIHIFAHGVLAPGYGAFMDAHPEVQLNLSTAVHNVEAVQGFTDMQVVFGAPQAHGAEGDYLLGEHLYPVAPPEIAAQITTPADLFDYRLIEVATHRAGWASVFDNLDIVPAAARYSYVDSTNVAMALAADGVGVALARAPASNRAMREAGLVPCLDIDPIEGREAYHLIYPSRAGLRPAAKVFRDWLLNWCAEFEQRRAL